MFHEVPSAGAARPAADRAVAWGRGSLWRAGVLPVGLAGIFLFLAGGIWDVSWHIDIGRDTFFSAPHLLLYAGLLSMALTPLWALVLGRSLRRVPDAELAGPAIRLRRVPINPGIVIGGLGALLAFVSGPVDEFWHRIFGLDVTIWSPPHMQLLFGAVLAVLGLVAALAGELNRADPERLVARAGAARLEPRWFGFVLAFAMLMMLLGGTLGEYSFAIPQHGLHWHPILLPAIALGVLFAAGRALGSAWGATAVAVCYAVVDVVLHAFLAAMGRTLPVYGVFVPAAVTVDVLWTQRGQSGALRRLLPAALASTLVVLASQLDFLRVESAVPWPLGAWPWVLPAALVAGAAGAALGARIGAALRPPAAAGAVTGGGTESVTEPPADARDGTASRGRIAAAAAAVVLAIGGAALTATTTAAQNRAPLRVEFRLTSAPPVAGEAATFELRFTPAGAVDLQSARMGLRQGDVRLPLRLEPTGEPGVLRGSAVPPSRGSWLMPLRFAERDGERWMSWASVQAAAAGQTWRAAVPLMELKLQPDRTRDLTAEDAIGLTVGKILVWATIGVAIGAGLYALRLVEQDGRRRVYAELGAHD